MYRFSSAVPRLAASSVRNFSASSPRNTRVTVIGAAGGIGQPLSLLLKLSPAITQLNLFDVVNVHGVAADVSHIETKAVVKGFTGNDQLEKSLEGAQIVLIPAGIPRKPGMTRDDLFSTNATIVFNIAKAAAKVCPDAFFGIITNPVNSTVPIATEVFKHHGLDNWRRVFGVTTLDVVRANTFLSGLVGGETVKTNVPVIGGHSGDTIMPLLSLASVGSQKSPSMPDGDREKLTKRIQNAGTEVVQAKAGAGSATLSMAFAANRFVISLLKAIGGRPDVVECAYVKNEKVGGQRIADVDFGYFAVPLVLSREGVAGTRFVGVNKLSAFEKTLLEKGTAELKANIEAGEKFARQKLGK